MLYYNVIVVLFHYLISVYKTKYNSSQFAKCPFAPPGGSFVNDFNMRLTCS